MTTHDDTMQAPTLTEEAALAFEQREQERSELDALMQMRPGLLNHVTVLKGVLAEDDPEELESARQAQIDDIAGLEDEFRRSEQYAPFFGGEEDTDVEW